MNTGLSKPCLPWHLALWIGFLINFSQAWGLSPTPDLDGFEKNIRPILSKYCFACHGPEKSKAKIRFDQVDPNIVSGNHQDIWDETREVFNNGEMPPEDEAQPNSHERELLSVWMDTEFKKAKLLRNPLVKSQLRRMTKYELKYALEDSFPLNADFAIEPLPDEISSSTTGLKNSAQHLHFSSTQLDLMMEAILTYLQKIRSIVQLKPIHIHFDIDDYESLRKEKLFKKFYFKGIKKVEQNLEIQPGGHLDLKIPKVSKVNFQILYEASSISKASITTSFGYRYAKNFKKEQLQTLGHHFLDTPQQIQIDYFPNEDEFKLDLQLDRPYFIRLSNHSNVPVQVHSFEFVGNISKHFKQSLLNQKNPRNDLLPRFLRSSFRRTPSLAELKHYQSIFDVIKASQGDILALLHTYEEILCSPKFLYFGLHQDKNTLLAEKLSSFLWCSLPDQALMDDAENKQLTNPKIMTQHINRMLKNPKSKRFVKHFSQQWLHPSKMFNIAVDQQYYRNFDHQLKDLMLQETFEAMNDVLRKGASALELLEARHVFVNQDLAQHYQLKGVKGDTFQKVILPEAHPRGGLLTQGTFLIGNSDGINSHAILRGVWLTETLLNDPPPSPPNNVPPLDESIPGFDQMTLNQKLEVHRNHDACKSCHQKIDPYGLAFENFDASGAWREKILVISKNEKKSKEKNRPVYQRTFLPVEADTILSNHHPLHGILDLKRYLVKYRKHDFSEGLVEKLLAYALSRDVSFHDEDLVRQLNRQFIQHQYSVPDLIHDIVKSDEFQSGEKR